MHKVYHNLYSLGYKTPMENLGYDPAYYDKIVEAVHSKVNMYTLEEHSAIEIWGWDPKSLRDEDRYRITELLRSYKYQEGRILDALRRLDADLADMRDSSEVKAKSIQEFRTSLADASAKRAKEKQDKDRASNPLHAGMGLVGDMVDHGIDTAVDLGQSMGLFPLSPDGPTPIIDLRDPEVARNVGPVKSLCKGGYSFCGDMWRLMDTGYGPERIPDEQLRDLVDLVLAVQAEYQLQSLLMDREFDRVINTRGSEFEYLKARAEAAHSTLLGTLGDVLGVVSAVSGVLALIPVLTPVAGPIAVVTATGALGAHVADESLRGDWDPLTIGSDVIGALPGIGALGKAAKAGTLTMRAVGKVGVASRAGGKAFLAAARSSEAGAVANYLGTKGAKVVGASAKHGKIAGKMGQAVIDLNLQVPTVAGLAGKDTSTVSSAATHVNLTQGMVNNAGDWTEMGAGLWKKGGNISLTRFAKAFA